MLSSTTAYINAGGRGTRLSGILPETEKGIAKAMLMQPGGTPLVDYHIQRALLHGYGNIVVNVGDQDAVGAHVSANYSQETKVVLATSDKRRGTGRDLIDTYNAARFLFEEFTVVSNADTILHLDDTALVELAAARNALGMIVTTTREDAPNRGAYVMDSSHKVVSSAEFDGTEVITLPTEGFRSASSCGTVALSGAALELLAEATPYSTESSEVSLYRSLLPKLFAQDGLYAYDNGDNFFLDVGTPANYARFLSMPVLDQPAIGVSDVA